MLFHVGTLLELYASPQRTWQTVLETNSDLREQRKGWWRGRQSLGKWVARTEYWCCTSFKTSESKDWRYREQSISNDSWLNLHMAFSPSNSCSTCPCLNKKYGRHALWHGLYEIPKLCLLRYYLEYPSCIIINELIKTHSHSSGILNLPWTYLTKKYKKRL